MYTFISTRQSFCINYFGRPPIENISFEYRKQSNILSITIKRGLVAYFLHKTFGGMKQKTYLCSVIFTQHRINII